MPAMPCTSQTKSLELMVAERRDLRDLRRKRPSILPRRTMVAMKATSYREESVSAVLNPESLEPVNSHIQQDLTPTIKCGAPQWLMTGFWVCIVIALAAVRGDSSPWTARWAVR